MYHPHDDDSQSRVATTEQAYLQDSLASKSLCQDDTSEPYHGSPAVPVLCLCSEDTILKGLLAGVSSVQQLNPLDTQDSRPPSTVCVCYK